MLKFNKMKERERAEKAEATVNILGHFNSSIIKTTSVASKGGGSGGPGGGQHMWLQTLRANTDVQQVFLNKKKVVWTARANHRGLTCETSVKNWTYDSFTAARRNSCRIKMKCSEFTAASWQ